MSDLTSSFGATLKIGDGADPEVFLSLSNVRDITGIDTQWITEDTTHHGTPGGWQSFLAVLRNMGTPTFEVDWITTNAGHQRLAEAHDSGDPVSFEIELSDNQKYEFSAIVQQMSTAAPVQGVNRKNVTLQPTGTVTPTLNPAA